MIRYLRLRENYTFSTTSPYVPPQPAVIFQTKDEFEATNKAQGVNVGLAFRF